MALVMVTPLQGGVAGGAQELGVVPHRLRDNRTLWFGGTLYQKRAGQRRTDSSLMKDWRTPRRRRCCLSAERSPRPGEQ
jgi:hypothetical protein